MKISTASNRADNLRRALPIAFAIGALCVLSPRAQAADADQINQVTVSAPTVQTVGRDGATGASIEQATVTARVQIDPVTLTTNSGVALLNDAVLAAARQACTDAGPFDDDGGTCVREAIKSAQPQVNALIARARSNANG